MIPEKEIKNHSKSSTEFINSKVKLQDEKITEYFSLLTIMHIQRDAVRTWAKQTIIKLFIHLLCNLSLKIVYFVGEYQKANC